MPDTPAPGGIPFRSSDFAIPEEALAYLEEIFLVRLDLVPLAQHHMEKDGSHTFRIFLDSSEPADGQPPFLAVRISWEADSEKFRYVSQRLPLLPLAQQWLVGQGCPAEHIGPQAGRRYLPPADDASRRLEEDLITSPGRHTLVDTLYDPRSELETVVLLHDHEATDTPFTVLIEELDLGSMTFTLRRNGFATEDAARQWMRKRPGPPPASSPAPAAQPSDPPGRRR